ncbi:MAG: proline dehydrogenase family protein [Prevotellaceae bacterium]|jgi:proline dehydrogenase|nr:proline dehydrogenase family protein [Prevotellaceae bacterium]
MIDFTNTQIAFEAKTNADLRRAKFLFNAIKYQWVVKLGKVFVYITRKLKLPVGWLLKPTIYKQFVGGETLNKCTPLAQQLMKYNILSIFDYSAEGGESAKDIQQTFDEFMRSIEYAKGNDNVAYTVFKPTALVTDKVLEKASAKIQLSDEEQKQYDEYIQKFETLCRRAYDNDVRILVDAEDYCFQDAIDELTEDMMRKFNKQRAIVFTTLQMYRHDRLSYLEKLYNDAIKNDYIIGMKFVRGAYMEKERERAKQFGYPDPICATKEATDENYNSGLHYVIEHIDKFEMFSGTHNEQSNIVLANLIDKYNIARNDKRIFFAQLYGMSDNLSYNLAHEGYNVTKYIPYAPVKTVLPYLIRRAEENTAIAGQTARELELIKTEIKRRKTEKKQKNAPVFDNKIQ